jgi:hypothetical protein
MRNFINCTLHQIWLKQSNHRELYGRGKMRNEYEIIVRNPEECSQKRRLKKEVKLLL